MSEKEKKPNRRGFAGLQNRLGPEGRKSVSNEEYIGINSQKSSPVGLIQLSNNLKARRVNWIAKPYIPRGMLTIIDGDPGEGKSQGTLAIAAAVTTGRPVFPGGPPAAPQSVLIYSAEDALHETLIPRLIAAEADMGNVFTRKGTFTIEDTETGNGLSLMDQDLAAAQPALVLIDPMVAYIGAKRDMYRPNEARDFTKELADRAERHGCAIVAVRHLRKQGSSKDLYKGVGSIDFTGAARSELLFERSKDGQQVMRHIKSNVGKKGPPLAYELVGLEVPGEDGHPVEISRLEWLGLYEEEDAELEQVVSVTKIERATVYLQETLKNGAKPALEVVGAAKLSGFSLKTLRNAKSGLARSVKIGDQWFWELCGGGNCDPLDQGWERPPLKIAA